MIELFQHPIFDGMSAESLALLSSDMVRYFRSGERIIGEDESDRTCLAILDGEVEVFSQGTFLSSRKAGEVVGEQAIIDNTKRSATVLAQGMVKVVLLPAYVIDRLMNDRQFVRNLAKSVSAKLREATSVRAIRFRNEERLFGEFGAHVSPALASRLLSQGTSYGDPRFQNVALLLADIRSFTDHSAKMTPEQIAGDLGAYLSEMVAVLFRHGAFVDKFIGDAILAVWGITPAEGNLAAEALDCAIEMNQRASTLHFGDEPIQMGVGLNAGRVFVGNVGSDQKRQFTVLGSAVNLAARLEAETKLLDAPIAIGSDFYALLPAERRENLRAHTHRRLKGIGEQTVYSWSPESARPEAAILSAKGVPE